MKRVIEAKESDFESKLHALLGVEKDEIGEIIEPLSVDQLSALLDAAMHDDAEEARKIVGIAKNNEDSKAHDKAIDDEVSTLLLSKDDLKKKFNGGSKKQKILKKSEQGREKAENTLTHGIGDEVAVEGEEATIKTPRAPGGTVGVMINGELKMVDKKDVHKLGEGVLGMTPMSGLRRMQELAGITGLNPEQDFNEPEPVVVDDHGPLSPGPVGLEGPEDMAPEPELGLDAPMDAPMGDPMGMDDGMGDDMGLGDPAPVMGGAPGDLGSDAVAPAPMGMEPDMTGGAMGGAPAPGLPGLPDVGSALEDAAALDQAISDIEAMIPNVKISEYKSLVSRLEGLVLLAKNAGKAAITEGVGALLKPKIMAKSPGKPSAKLFAQPVKEDEDVAEGRVRDAVVGGAAAAALTVAAGGMAKGAHDYHRGGGNQVGIEKRDTDLNNNWRDAAKKSRGGHEVHEDKLSVMQRARDIVARGSGEKEEDMIAPDADGDETKEVGRKTLFDYMREAETGEQETIGMTRSDAAKNLLARMGPGATPADAEGALAAMMKSGAAKQQGSSFTMDPMDDDQFQANVNMVKNQAPKPGQPAPQKPGMTTGQKTTNPGANVQGSSNGNYQGG